MICDFTLEFPPWTRLDIDQRSTLKYSKKFFFIIIFTVVSQKNFFIRNNHRLLGRNCQEPCPWLVGGKSQA